MPLKYLFVDMNSYFASVEQQMRPELRGRPVAVVPVCAETTCCIAASYEAKAYGVKTAMGGRQATQLCPRAIVVPPRMAAYTDASAAVFEVFHDTTPLVEPLSVDDLAHRSHMSPRTFARRFRSVTGTTPHQWLLSQRIMLAQRLLETTDVAVEIVAERCGFGTAANLRHHFQRVVATSPLAYRRTFRTEAG